MNPCKGNPANVLTTRKDYNPCLWHEHGDDQKHIENAHKEQIGNWVHDVMDRI
jgi:hypothetical protein